MATIDDIHAAARRMAGVDISRDWTVAQVDIRDVRLESNTATLAITIRPKNQRPGVQERSVAERLELRQISAILTRLTAIVDFLGDVLHAEEPRPTDLTTG